tara:strand:+ start:5032 stop:6777 length:1746 start_codon:yes stop_codon:yes gene_type:complete
MARKGKGFSYNRVAEPPEYTPSASRGTGYAPYIGITEAKEGEDLSYRDDSIGFKRVSRGGGYRNTTGRKLEDKKLRLTDTKLTKPVASGIKLGSSDSGVGFTIDVDAANSKFEVKDNTGSSATKPIVITGGDNNDGSINIDGSGVLTDVNDKFIQNAKFGDFLTASASGGQAGNLKVGQTDYDTGTGVFLGDDDGTFRFSLGNENANKIRWTGSVLDITGAVNVTNASSQSATTTMTGGGITLSGGGAIKSTGKDSATDTTNGFFLGHDGGSSYDFAVGGSSHSMVFDGSAGTLTITGAITATSGAIGGWSLGSTTLTGGNLVLSSGGSITVADGYSLNNDGSASLGDGHFLVNNNGNIHIQGNANNTGVIYLHEGADSKDTDDDAFRIFHDNSGNVFKITYNANGRFELENDGDLRVQGEISFGDLSSNDCKFTRDAGKIKVSMSSGSSFYPATNDNHDVGNDSYRWDDIYATNGTIDTSDRNEKESIQTSTLGLNFISALNPVSYVRKGKTRSHYGLIAQEVKTVLDSLSIDTSKFAGYVNPSSTGGEGALGLRYHEFIAPMIKAIQELKSEIDTLKSQ